MASKKKATESKVPSKTNLYGKAQQVLRDRHIDEFEKIVKELYAEHGYTYTRRLTPEEREAKKQEEQQAKAEAKLERLLQQHPDLRDRLKDEEEANEPLVG